MSEMLSATTRPIRRGRALAWLTLVAGIYLLGLWYVDRDKQILTRLQALALPLCGCVALVLASYGFRHLRWHMLLRAQGQPTGWRAGLLAYLAGFAFTASPGKAGELLRIRYFSRLGVPAQVTLTTFIYERALDLLVITALSLGAAHLIPLFGLLASAVLCLVLALCLVACLSPLQRAAIAVIDRLPGQPVRRLARFLVAGTTSLRPLLRPGLTAASTACGLAAWLLTSAAFAWLCYALGIVLPWQYALAIYPLAMLIGALSFVPGGVGTTEAAIVLMLAASGADLDTALAAAIGIRLASLWLAVAVGMAATVALEARTPATA
ncbi:TIGR00374 family protein [Stenotrophomonas maltophilia]|nr:flippase-like domain-containing protein [Stenotrophomonas maltophilia]MBA0374943.1 TIGR00374 family protein [Stenotrophomonas maltophilia]MBA0544988.1 TIGR00374 family protein [Stenotrophomonas maltophilia]QQA83154.1 flippase-like domain-containing protein [Stenotrophomonas maltophilia]HDS1016448.1 flippase-like domain-containing protein [Stenotrophomonas maltophilia]